MNNLNLVETVVSVSGQTVHFVELNLHQKFYEHHRCQILVDHDAFGDKKWMIDPVRIFKMIGASVFITMTHRNTKETNVFSGIVSNISFQGKNGAQNFILIEGVSDSIKLSGQPSMDSFVDKTLDSIVKEAVGNSGNGANVTIQPEYKKPIEYIQQYNESAFDFLRRLSFLYGEAFWNDGATTYWGKPNLDDTIMLNYELEMTDFDLKASLLPPKLKNYEYLKFDDEERNKETRTDVPEAAGYLQPIVDIADSIYTSDVITPLEASVLDTDSILKMVDIERTKTVANMLILSGKTQTCRIGLGKVVTVVFPDYMEITTSAGAFIITEITHTVDQKGYYGNSFSGVRAALGYIPMQPIQLPIASPERASVLSNADPENKGRIKVQFAWQKLKGKETNWLRVQTPDAGGGGDKVASNRGLVTIPEEGDTVMINFEYGDSNRPYSTGSLFTSKTGGGGGQGNKNKSLTTRSGSTVSLDDDKGSVTIKDKNGSDTKITLDGDKKILIEADTSIEIKIAKKQCVFKMNNLGEASIETTAKFEVKVGENTLTMTPDNTILSTPNDVKFTSKTSTLEGKTTATVKQAGSSIVLDGEITLKGEKINSNYRYRRLERTI